MATAATLLLLLASLGCATRFANGSAEVAEVLPACVQRAFGVPDAYAKPLQFLYSDVLSGAEPEASRPGSQHSPRGRSNASRLYGVTKTPNGLLVLLSPCQPFIWR